MAFTEPPLALDWYLHWNEDGGREVQKVRGGLKGYGKVRRSKGSLWRQWRRRSGHHALEIGLLMTRRWER